jgi:(1->4)-alpha-D-glucan 1-alpha-D-glucosylmutase
MHALVDACYDDEVIAPGLAALAADIRADGWSNSLGAKLIQLTLPGVPDVYRGTEIWQNSLVDPDNRRPVDFEALATLLDRIDGGWIPDITDDGAAKMLVTARALRLRREDPRRFAGYTPLHAIGPVAEHLVAFSRGGVISLATRLPLGLRSKGGWADTRLPLPPGVWSDALTGAGIGSGQISVGQVLARYPVALLVRQA